MLFRNDPDTEVVGFTATQIPHIDERRYLAALAGERYPEGIAVFPEEELESLVEELRVDQCVMAYSDVSHEQVMHLVSRAGAAGADFVLLAPRRTMLESSRPVIAVTASRTGAGKSQTTRALARILRDQGLGRPDLADVLAPLLERARRG